MNYGGHLVGGFALGVGCTYLASMNQIQLDPLVLLVTATASSLLPDIDHPKSYVGRRIPLISKFLYKTVGHRTLTHSFLFAFGLPFIVYPTHKNIALGLFVGIISHILLDTIPPCSKGCALFYPISKRKIRVF